MWRSVKNRAPLFLCSPDFLLHEDYVAYTEANDAEADDANEVRPDSQQTLTQADWIGHHKPRLCHGNYAQAFYYWQEKHSICFLEEVTGRET